MEAEMSAGKLLTLRECSERTGHRESTWRAWVLKRKIPFYKVGRSVRVSENDLEKLIEKSRVPAMEFRNGR
jgi:excisionase family DNA binding protein